MRKTILLSRFLFLLFLCFSLIVLDSTEPSSLWPWYPYPPGPEFPPYPGMYGMYGLYSMPVLQPMYCVSFSYLQASMMSTFPDIMFVRSVSNILDGTSFTACYSDIFQLAAIYPFYLLYWPLFLDIYFSYFPSYFLATVSPSFIYILQALTSPLFYTNFYASSGLHWSSGSTCGCADFDRALELGRSPI